MCTAGGGERIETSHALSSANNLYVWTDEKKGFAPSLRKRILKIHSEQKGPSSEQANVVLGSIEIQRDGTSIGYTDS